MPDARIVQHPHMRGMDLGQPLGRAGEVELDDLGRARADEEQLPDVRAPLEQTGDLAVELFMRVGEAGEVLLFEDGGAEARLGEDHDAGGRLQEVRAGAAAHHKEEGILHLAVQPDDPGEAAEDLALATLLQDGGVAAAGPGGKGREVVHAAASSPCCDALDRASASA